ncbi:MAG: prephenate dehydratase, partial [Bacillariaceae sp.]
TTHYYRCSSTSMPKTQTLVVSDDLSTSQQQSHYEKNFDKLNNGFDRMTMDHDENNTNASNNSEDEEKHLTSLLMELPNRVGILHDVLRFFWKFDVNIRRIESRPSKFGKFDFFVDVERTSGSGEKDERLENLLASLEEYGVEKLLILGEKEGT